MTVFDRLPTKCRLLSFGMHLDGLCILYRKDLETQDHLFFQCEFSTQAWGSVLQLCQTYRGVTSWSLELAWVCGGLRRRSLMSMILMLARNSLISLIWREKNVKLFRNQESSRTEIVARIKEAIKFRLRG
ncbi:uncharacterized protein LOC120176751 [Hibiscus syriacus]|uniref:uncharacterized protein LOC120176751 n=1 Tax=Hibiscus syriacus TaxID=106335 RepID=UPI00192125E8|nr:uncharacterized protein LOC120176751 [Hibiscus syriacus]